MTCTGNPYRRSYTAEQTVCFTAHRRSLLLVSSCRRAAGTGSKIWRWRRHPLSLPGLCPTAPRQLRWDEYLPLSAACCLAEYAKAHMRPTYPAVLCVRLFRFRRKRGRRMTGSPATPSWCALPGATPSTWSLRCGELRTTASSRRTSCTTYETTERCHALPMETRTRCVYVSVWMVLACIAGTPVIWVVCGIQEKSHAFAFAGCRRVSRAGK